MAMEVSRCAEAEPSSHHSLLITGQLSTLVCSVTSMTTAMIRRIIGGNASTLNICLAVRVNLGKLMEGDTMLDDQHPDAQGVKTKKKTNFGDQEAIGLVLKHGEKECTLIIP